MKESKDFIFDKSAIKRNCDEFFSLYDVTKGDVHVMCERKKRHTEEVARNCLMIAKNMGLDDYNCDLAWVIGEFHDFARFGQAVNTHSFVDSKKYDHAKIGANILFVHHLADDIIPDYDKITDTDRQIMYKAVLYHNDYALPGNLTEREKLFCNIVRDADKLDIFRNVIESGYENVYGCTFDELKKSDISPAMEEAFCEHRPADYKKRVTKADYLMAHIALYFGLVEDSSKQRAKEEGYLKKMMDIKFADPAVQKKYLKMKEQLKIFDTAF